MGRHLQTSVEQASRSEAQLEQLHSVLEFSCQETVAFRVPSAEASTSFSNSSTSPARDSYEALESLCIQREGIHRRMFAALLSRNLEDAVRLAWMSWRYVTAKPSGSLKDQAVEQARNSLGRRESAALALISRLLAAQLVTPVMLAFRSWASMDSGMAASSLEKPQPSRMLALPARSPAEVPAVAMRLVASLLASQLEILARGAFISWRSATAKGHSKISLREALHFQTQEDAPAKQELAVVNEVWQQQLAVREAAARSLLCSLLAQHLAGQVHWAFAAWRIAVRNAAETAELEGLRSSLRAEAGVVA